MLFMHLFVLMFHAHVLYVFFALFAMMELTPNLIVCTYSDNKFIHSLNHTSNCEA